MKLSIGTIAPSVNQKQCFIGYSRQWIRLARKTSL